MDGNKDGIIDKKDLKDLYATLGELFLLDIYSLRLSVITKLASFRSRHGPTGFATRRNDQRTRRSAQFYRLFNVVR